MVGLIEFLHLIDDLAFLQTAVANGCQYGIPVPEAVFSHDRVHIIRLHDLYRVDALCLTVSVQHLTALYNIVILQFIFKPLIDLALCLCTLDQIQPVPAGTFGILGSQDLHPVTIVDLVINGHQLSVHSGSDHLISHCTVNTVGKINGRRACRQSLYFSVGSKTIHTVGKQIQIVLQQIHKFLIIGHISLPFQDLTQPGKLFFFLTFYLFTI